MVQRFAFTQSPRWRLSFSEWAWAFIRMQVGDRVPTNPPSGKVGHDIGDEKFTGLYVIPAIGIDQQVDAGVLVLPDQIDGLGHGTDKAT